MLAAQSRMSPYCAHDAKLILPDGSNKALQKEITEASGQKVMQMIFTVDEYKLIIHLGKNTLNSVYTMTTSVVAAAIQERDIGFTNGSLKSSVLNAMAVKKAKKTLRTR